MNDPRANIRAGIDAIDRAKAGDSKPKLLRLIGVKGSVPNLQEIQIKAKKARDRLLNLRTAELSLAQKAEADIRAKWKEHGVFRDEKGIRTDTIGDMARNNNIAREIKAVRKVRLEATAEERGKLLTVLRETKESLALMRKSWVNPVSVLMNSTLASPERATYAANLANAGAHGVEGAMRQALALNDQALAAAAVERYDLLDETTRSLVSFSKDDIAAAMVHDEWSKAAEAIGLSDYAVESGELAEREMRGDKISPDQKIRVGQRLMELEAKIGRKLDADGNVVDPDGEPVKYTGKVSISESNRRWFAEHGTYGTGGEINAD